LNSGGILAHRNPQKSEDEPEIPCQPVRVPAEKLAHDIRRAARKDHSAKDKIRIVLEGLECEESIKNTEK
jgi:hypothetical protein